MRQNSIFNRHGSQIQQRAYDAMVFNSIDEREAAERAENDDDDVFYPKRRPGESAANFAAREAVAKRMRRW